MWCERLSFYTLCVIFGICEASPAPYRNRDVGVLKELDHSEKNGTRMEIHTAKVEDYEDVYDYIKSDIRSVLGTKVELVNVLKGQEARKSYVAEKKNLYKTRKFSGGKTNQGSVFDNNKATERLTEKLEEKELEKLSSLNISEGSAKVRIKRMNVIHVGGCPAGMISTQFGCSR